MSIIGYESRGWEALAFYWIVLMMCAIPHTQTQTAKKVLYTQLFS